MSTATQPTILLVEDHAIAQKTTRLVLQSFQCLVETASSGAEALNMIKNNQYHLILMDLGLPDVDGITLSETIRRMVTNGRDIPILALTAHDDHKIRSACIGAGMNDFIVKPLTHEKCKFIIANYVPLVESPEKVT